MIEGNGQRVLDRLQQNAQNSNMAYEDFMVAVARCFRYADWTTAELFLESMDREFRQWNENTQA